MGVCFYSVERPYAKFPSAKARRRGCTASISSDMQLASAGLAPLPSVLLDG